MSGLFAPQILPRRRRAPAPVPPAPSDPHVLAPVPPAPSDPHVMTRGALEDVAGGPTPARSGLPRAVFRADGRFAPLEVPRGLEEGTDASRAGPVPARAPTLVAVELARARYAVAGYGPTKWGGWQKVHGHELQGAGAAILEVSSELVGDWAQELDRGRGALAASLRAEMLFARDMFHEMAETIRAVYAGHKSKAEEHFVKAQAYVSDAWASIQDYGAEVVTAVGVAVATGAVSIGAGATLTASAIGAGAATLGIGAAVVLVAAIGYAVVTAKSSGGRKAAVEFFRSEGVHFTPGDFDRYLATLSRAMIHYRDRY